MILRNSWHFAKTAWEWSAWKKEKDNKKTTFLTHSGLFFLLPFPTNKSLQLRSTVLHTVTRAVKLNFALLVSFHYGSGHYCYLATVAALRRLFAGLHINSLEKVYAGSPRDQGEICKINERFVLVCRCRCKLDCRSWGEISRWGAYDWNQSCCCSKARSLRSSSSITAAAYARSQSRHRYKVCAVFLDGWPHAQFAVEAVASRTKKENRRGEIVVLF